MGNGPIRFSPGTSRQVGKGNALRFHIYSVSFVSGCEGKRSCCF